ncbi:hypothetical protein BSKO_09612 [Bryopsis sp. KO-2023]|nr:hypothetical protein BSKO_09612 [Bryopsis sp. KO-2023]
MAKKLINDPKNVVLEMLEGAVACNPRLRLLDGLPDIKVVYDAERDPSKVALVSGGGSGHEPAHAGYVGPGMLTAAVCGEVFASPSVTAVLAAIRKVTGPAGCLLIVKNYTGDRLNFGIAAEQAKLEGLRVEMVVVGEDCAVSGGIAGRRGLAGTVFVHKAAGAVADKGGSLANVTEVAKKVAESVGTVGVALTVCTLPGAPVSDRLKQDQIELGLGIHGEPGAEVTDKSSADDIVGKVLRKISNCGFFPLDAGQRVALMVNNLGSTPDMELFVVARASLTYCKVNLGLAVEVCYVGSYMTSLDMAGVSLTLCKIDDKTLDLLRYPTEARGWLAGHPGVVDGKSYGSMPGVVSETTPPATRPESLTQVGSTIEKALLQAMDCLIRHEPELTEWDALVGDGDCGTTMKRGAEHIKKSVAENYPLNSPAGVARSLADSVNASMGGTSGALYSVFFLAAASVLQSLEDGSQPTVDEWCRAFESGVEAIEKYGGARVGCRTMLDAMVPAKDTLREGISKPLKKMAELVGEMVEAARQGADETKNMIATAGRASYVPGELMKTAPDPGAKAVQFWLEGVHEALSSES